MERAKDSRRFAELMVNLAIAIGKDVSDERVELYFNHLQEFDIKTLERAFHHLIRTEKIPAFPTIGKIRFLIEGDEDEKAEGDALLAWGKACELVWNHGDSGEPTGDDLLDEAVRIAFGGWKYFGDTNPQYEGADRRHFINVYKSIAKRVKRLKPRQAELRKQLMENREKLSKVKDKSEIL